MGAFHVGIVRCALHAGRCMQLLWREGQGLVRDPRTFELQATFPLPAGCAEGWGLTHDGGQQLFLSDGTSRLYVLDARTFRLTRTIDVTVGRRPLRRLNELQWIRGEVRTPLPPPSNRRPLLLHPLPTCLAAPGQLVGLGCTGRHRPGERRGAPIRRPQPAPQFG